MTTTPVKTKEAKAAVSAGKKKAAKPEVEAKWNDAPNRVVASTGTGPNFLSKKMTPKPNLEKIPVFDKNSVEY